jgi:hypothetical protein
VSPDAEERGVPAGADAVRPDAPFEEPWQARAFAMAIVATERLGLPHDAFRERLKAAVAARPDQPYFESWMDALEALLADAE